MRVVVLSARHRFADDLAAALAPIATARGFEVAREGTGELVIEIPPRPEPVLHYKDQAVNEIWRIDPETRAFEVYRLWADSYDLVGPAAGGGVPAPALEVELSVVGGQLRIAWTGGVVLV